jgi:hypothetical protein
MNYKTRKPVLSGVLHNVLRPFCFIPHPAYYNFKYTPSPKLGEAKMLLAANAVAMEPEMPTFSVN